MLIYAKSLEIVLKQYYILLNRHNLGESVVWTPVPLVPRPFGPPVPFAPPLFGAANRNSSESE